MARLPRVTLADLPYHITQRGNRRQPVFFTEADRHVYLTLLQEQTRHYGVEGCGIQGHITEFRLPRKNSSEPQAVVS